MYTLVLTNQKGGVGKTTLSLNIAYALHQLGKQVVFLNLDQQRTANDLADKLGLVHHQALTMVSLKACVATLEADYCVVDLGGFESAFYTEVLHFADAIAYPISDSGLDMAGLRDTLHYTRDLRGRKIIIPNRIHPLKTKYYEAFKAVEALGFVITLPIHDSPAYGKLFDGIMAFDDTTPNKAGITKQARLLDVMRDCGVHG